MDLTKFKEFGDGAGSSSQAEVQELLKALEAGQGSTPATQTGGGALRVESLDSALKVLTYKASHTKMWRDIPKDKAYNTVEEYSELSDYGSDDSSFYAEGELPVEDDATYARKASLVKFMGTTRKVTHPMTLVQNIGGDVIARETNNGILKVMKDADIALFWGNSDLVNAPSTNEGLQFDGLNKLIDATNDLDLANANMGEKDAMNVAETVADNYGNITDLYGSFPVIRILSEELLPKGRVAQPAADGFSAGLNVSNITTPHGNFKLNAEKFLGVGQSPMKPAPAAATSALAPTAPQATTEATQAGTTAKFRSAQANGSAIKFSTSYSNKYGESAATALSTGVTITDSAAERAKLIPVKAQNASSVVTAPEWCNVYATEPGGSVAYLVYSFGVTTQVADEYNTYNYDGYLMPKTSIAFAGELAAEILRFKQLAPIMKMDLAILGPAYRFMVLLYGVLQLYAPKKWMRIVNIKTT